MIDRHRPLRIYALEIHAVSHCNLRCRGCAQGSPGAGERYEDLDLLASSLGSLRGVIRCDKLQVLGGEPLLHPQIGELLAIVRRSGLSDRLCVKTNGLLLPLMQEAFWRAIDQVIVSAYPASSAALERQRAQVEELAKARNVSLDYRQNDVFRFIQGETARASDRLTRRIWQRCEYKSFTHSLSAGRLYRCAPSVNARYDGTGPTEADSLDLLDASDHRGAVERFLRSPTPLDSCRRCLGSSGGSFAHVMMRPARTTA